jgi:septum formation protein
VLTSVGVYQLEGLGLHLFDRIEGDLATILGIPMIKLLAWLRRENLISP